MDEGGAILLRTVFTFTVVQPCGGAIPLCMVDEFDLPAEIIDRKVTKMKMISPSNREVDVGRTLSETEYIGMCRREVLDSFLRNRAQENGATVINGLVMRLEQVRGFLSSVYPTSDAEVEHGCEQGWHVCVRSATGACLALSMHCGKPGRWHTTRRCSCRLQ